MPTALAQLAPSPLPKRDRRLLFVTIALIACAFAGRIAFIGQPVNSDTAMFVYMGKLVSQGGRMGVDLVDNKLPSVGLLMSAPYRLFGAGWSMYAILGLAMSILATAALTRAAGRCLGPAARWPVLIAAALFLNFTPAVFGQLQLETIEVFFTCLAAAAAMELLRTGDWRDGVASGLAIGIAMWAKPTAGAILPAIVLAITFATDWPMKKRLVATTAIAIGVLIPLATCAALVYATGMADALPATLAQLKDYSSNSSADAIDLLKPLVVLGVVLFPILMLGWVFRRDRIGAKDEGGRMKDEKGKSVFILHPSSLILRFRVFILAWLLMELLAVISQRRMYAYHFLVLAPPAALLPGLLPRIPSARSLLLAFGPLVAASFLLALPMMRLSPDTSRYARVTAYLQTNASQHDAVWEDDYARLLVETDLRPGSRVPLIFLFANSDRSPAAFSQQMLSDFRTRDPRFVVLPQDTNRLIDLYQNHMIEMVRYPARAQGFADAIRNVQLYVESCYTPRATIDGVVIWQRTDTTTNDQANVNLNQ